MKEKKMRATPIEATPTTKDMTKIANNPEKEKDLSRVLNFFCALATKILRNSIAWHIRSLEDMGAIKYLGG